MHPLTAINGRRGTPTITPPKSTPYRCTPKRVTTGLQLPTGKCDLEAVRAVIDDWLVPLLVKEFLAEHKASMATSEVGKNQQGTKHPRRKR